MCVSSKSVSKRRVTSAGHSVHLQQTELAEVCTIT